MAEAHSAAAVGKRSDVDDQSVAEGSTNATGGSVINTVFGILSLGSLIDLTTVRRTVGASWLGLR
jgi:hypothetical protein